jgi:hypothetical protein
MSIEMYEFHGVHRMLKIGFDPKWTVRSSLNMQTTVISSQPAPAVNLYSETKNHIGRILYALGEVLQYTMQNVQFSQGHNAYLIITSIYYSASH